LDKRIPVVVILAFVGTIFTQSLIGVWWIRGIVNRLDNSIEINAKQDSRLTTVEGIVSASQINQAIASQQMTAVRETLAEVKSAQAETNRLLRDIVAEQKAKP
jgi:predicted RNA-binding protein